MRIQPYCIGSGRSADAIQKALFVISQTHPHYEILPTLSVPRGQSVPRVQESAVDFKNVLFIANPHALHAPALLEAAAHGFDAAVVEKPAAVNKEQIDELTDLKIPVAVLHGYRESWGIHTLRRMHTEGQFGELIAVEGRYWQSSAASRAIQPNSAKRTWKDDPSLSGHYDTLIDIGVHWLDAACALVGAIPQKGVLSLSHLNSGHSAHRDSHAQIFVRFPGGATGMGSISKTLHGENNRFEITMIGTLKSATWRFLAPDEIEIGEGGRKTILPRVSGDTPSSMPPFHALGWIEGYIGVIEKLLRELEGDSSVDYPRLPKHLEMLRALFEMERL